MNVSLTPQLERMVHKKVKSGAYQSASEVVREALRLMQEREKTQAQRLAELRAEIKKGLDQFERGEYTTVPVENIPEYMESLKARAIAQMKGRRKGR